MASKCSWKTLYNTTGCLRNEYTTDVLQLCRMLALSLSSQNIPVKCFDLAPEQGSVSDTVSKLGLTDEI